MKKFLVIFAFMLLVASSGIAQTKTKKVSKDNCAKVFIPKDAISPCDIRPDQILTNVKIPETSAPATTPTKTKTPPPSLAMGYSVKEAEAEEKNLWGLFYFFTVMGFLVAFLAILLFFFGGHRRERRARRQRVIEHKEKKFSFGRKEGSVIFDHDSSLH